MRRTILVSAFLFSVAAVAQGQQDAAVVITRAQIDQGVNLPTKAIDRMLRIVDLDGYQLGITAAKHEANKGKSTAATGRGPNSKSCGTATAPPGGDEGPGDGIYHADTTETYMILSGTGTLVTGGQILNGFWSATDSDTDRILTGPSCIGLMVGKLTKQKVSEGDVVVIPAGVAHGWLDLEAEITYLIVRTDTKNNLQHGYVNPAIR